MLLTCKTKCTRGLARVDKVVVYLLIVATAIYSATASNEGLFSLRLFS